MSLNNEQVGISAEVAIADFFNILIAANYRSRGSQAIINSILMIIPEIFSKNNIQNPIKHVAENQNLVDFNLAENKTLSIKTNKQKLGKAAPQKVGQASSNTWFNLLAEKLGIAYIPTNYDEKVRLFKIIALTRIDKLLSIYWQYMFDCDFLIYIFNVVDNKDNLTNNPNYVVFKKTSSPIWEPDKITFTKPTVAEWSESNTVKYEYDRIPIGEFQIHNNRDNFKFRFNIAGIEKLINENRLNFS